MRGKKTPPETIYAIMAVNAVTNNLSETSRILNVPVSTVEDIVKEHENDEEFAKLRKNVKDDFVIKATELIDLVLDAMKSTIISYDGAIPLNQLSTTLNSLYDKRALALGESTENSKITFELPKELDDFAG